MTSRFRATVIAVVLGVLLGAAHIHAQAQDSVIQMTLAQSPKFRTRLQYLLVQQARVVLAETGVGATHAKRASYAAQVIANPDAEAKLAAVVIVGGVNLIGTVVTNSNNDLIDSSANDASILSQIATFWNALAKVDTGS